MVIVVGSSRDRTLDDRYKLGIYMYRRVCKGCEASKLNDRLINVS
jgi:hypothetical protein